MTELSETGKSDEKSHGVVESTAKVGPRECRGVGEACTGQNDLLRQLYELRVGFVGNQLDCLPTVTRKLPFRWESRGIESKRFSREKPLVRRLKNTAALGR